MRASNFQQIAGDRSIEQDRQSRTQNQNSSETEQRVPVQNQRRNLTKFDTSSVDTKQYKEPGNSKLLRQSSAQLYDEGKSQMSPHILRSKSTPLSKVEDPPQREDIQNKHLKLNAHEFPISVNINSLIFGSLIHQAVTGCIQFCLFFSACSCDSYLKCTRSTCECTLICVLPQIFFQMVFSS